MWHWIPALVDLIGYAAAALVLLAFSLRSLIALRSVAIASNLTFIAYASAAHRQPVLVLHAALLPINLWRLGQCFIPRSRAGRLKARLVHGLERNRS
jgi:CRP/FNR family transcriptional regulator, cyclic AMP receptor protein